MAIRTLRRAHRALQTILSTLGPGFAALNFVTGLETQRVSPC